MRLRDADPILKLADAGDLRPTEHGWAEAGQGLDGNLTRVAAVREFFERDGRHLVLGWTAPTTLVEAVLDGKVLRPASLDQLLAAIR